MVDNTPEFGGNEHLRRALQDAGDAARCASCQFHEGQQVQTPAGQVTITLVESALPDGGTAPLCQGCREMFKGLVNQAVQMAADRPAEMMADDDTPEMKGGQL